MNWISARLGLTVCSPVIINSALSQCVGKITDTELDICYYKAAAQYAGGDIEGALATYQAMIDYDEENGNAYYLHGCLSLKQQDTDTAKKDFANAVKYNPDDYELYVGIYENLAGNNMTEEGEEYSKTALDIIRFFCSTSVVSFFSFMS